MQNVRIKTEIILSLVLGTRSSGLAVFEGVDLIYYGIKEASKHRLKHTPHSRAKEVARVVEQAIHKYRPNHFVTPAPYPFQHFSPKLPVIAEHVMNIAGRFDLTCHEYQRTEIRKQLCPSRQATRQAVAEHLVVLYPELSRYTAGVSYWQRLYYARMLEAVAAGYVYTSQLQRERERFQLAQLDEQAHSININHP